MGRSIDECRRSSKVVMLDGDGAVLLFCGGDPARPEAEGWDDIERQSIVQHRWWSLDELVDTHETVHPDGLAELIVRHR